MCLGLWYGPLEFQNRSAPPEASYGSFPLLRSRCCYDAAYWNYLLVDFDTLLLQSGA